MPSSCCAVMPTLATNASYIIEWIRLNNVLFSPTLPIFLPALPFLGRRRLCLLQKCIRTHALSGIGWRKPHAQITVRRFERPPPRSASMKHPIIRTLLDLCLLLFLRRTEKNSTSSQKKSWTFAENKLDTDFQYIMCGMRDFTHTFLFFGVLFDELCRMRMLCWWAMSKCRLFCSPYI